MNKTADTILEADKASESVADDLAELRLEQARLLYTRTRTSCLIVQGVIVYLTALMAWAGDYRFAALWLSLTTAMVLAVYLYPKIIAPGGVTPENYQRYLKGHIVISTATGLLWAALAGAYLDQSSVLHLFISMNAVSSITIGGMLPSAEYRPTFLGLLTGMVVPFSIYWLATIDGPARLIGVGLLIYYAFGVLVSARAEVQTAQALSAERNRRLVEQLNQQNRLIEKASLEKSRFLAATSHDLSQPLQAQGFLMGALRRTLDRADQTDLLDKIEDAWRSQRHLLQALVETTRLSSGSMKPRPRAFQLQPLLDKLQSEFADIAAAKNQRFIMESCPAALQSDPLIVIRILRNLVSNALKFTPEGGEVRVSCLSEDAGVFIQVSDTGPGLSSDQIEAAFEEYVQLDLGDGVARSGVGLGLSIVRELSCALDAELRYDSQPGAGVRAGIVLPLTRHAPEPAPAASFGGRIDGAPLIVIIEDEQPVREGLTLLLSDWGCRVIAAASGKEAVELIQWVNDGPALLVVDKRLGRHESGIDAIAALREELADTVPALLLTGDVYNFEGLEETPDVSVLPKPADPEQIYEALLRVGARTG